MCSLWSDFSSIILWLEWFDCAYKTLAIKYELLSHKSKWTSFWNRTKFSTRAHPEVLWHSMDFVNDNRRNWIGRYYNNRYLNLCQLHHHDQWWDLLNHMIAFVIPRIIDISVHALISRLVRCDKRRARCFYFSFKVKRNQLCHEFISIKRSVCAFFPCFFAILKLELPGQLSYRYMHFFACQNSSARFPFLVTNLPTSAAVRIAFILEISHILYHPLVYLAQR